MQAGHVASPRVLRLPLAWDYEYEWWASSIAGPFRPEDAHNGSKIFERSLTTDAGILFKPLHHLPERELCPHFYAFAIGSLSSNWLELRTTAKLKWKGWQKTFIKLMLYQKREHLAIGSSAWHKFKTFACVLKPIYRASK